MTAKITGGIIAYEFGQKANEEYAPAKKARVELRFDLEEGSDPSAAAAQVMALCIEHVHGAIGIASSPAKKGRTKPVEAAVQPAEVQAAKPATDKDKLAQAAGLPASNDPAGMTEIGQTHEKNVASALASSKVVAENIKQHEKQMAGNAGDPAAMPGEPASDDFLGDNTPKTPLSDQDLNTAAIKKNQEINDGARIRKLTTEFGGNGMSVASVPQDNRHAFLKALIDLKKAA